MDFSAWSPSHLIIAAISIAIVIAQVTYLFSRLKSAIEHLGEKMDVRFIALDKRFDDVNKRIDETNQQVADVRDEIRDVRGELRQLNQNHIEHLNRHH